MIAKDGWRVIRRERGEGGGREERDARAASLSSLWVVYLGDAEQSGSENRSLVKNLTALLSPGPHKAGCLLLSKVPSQNR